MIAANSITLIEQSGSGVVNGGSVSALSADTANYYTVQMTEFCSNDNGGTQCPNTYTSKVRLTGFKNPATSASPTKSWKIIISTSGGAQIDQVITGIFATPTIALGPLQSVAITRSSNIVGDIPTFSVSFKLSNALADSKGYIYIGLPAGFLYFKTATSTCTI